MVPNRIITVSSTKIEAKWQVHKCFAELVKVALYVLGNDDQLCRYIFVLYPSADIAADDHESGETASSSAGGFASGFSGSSVASGMVAQ